MIQSNAELKVHSAANRYIHRYPGTVTRVIFPNSVWTDKAGLIRAGDQSLMSACTHVRTYVQM